LSAVTWTAFGVGLRRLLRDPAHARIFNIAMAVLLVASIVPMVM
jgi:threonine/homoserine/homoserine lactone efflux protein